MRCASSKVSVPDDRWRAGLAAGRASRSRSGIAALAVAVTALLIVSMLTLTAGSSAVAGSGSASGARTPAAGLSRAVTGGVTSSEILPMIPEPASVPSACVDANASEKYPVATTGYLELEGNLFNLSTGDTGSSDLCYNAAGGVLSDHTDVDTPGAVPHKVIGFPEAILGQNIYGGVSALENPALPLPGVTVSNITGEDLWSSVNYTMQIVDRTPYNLAFDDWLTKTPANSTLGRNPGDRIEVMVWFADNIGMDWLPQTAVATSSIPTFLNGSAAPGGWFRDQWCQDNDSQLTIDYLYAENDSVGYGTQDAQIAVNMSAVMANVESVTLAGGKEACWAHAGANVSGLYAANTPFGAEFYPNLNTSYSQEEELNWSLSSWCYTIVAGTPTGSGTDCGPGTGGTASPVQPTASANVTSGEWPLDVNFTGAVSGGAGPFEYTWSFGAGLGGSNSQNTNYTYWQPGTYEANLTVVDYDDIATSPNVAITVLPVPTLAVSLAANPSSITTGNVIKFTASVSGGRLPYRFQWWGLPNGPGCTSTNTSTVNCTAESNGTYKVVVGVNDPGSYAQASTNISITGTGSAPPSNSTGPPPSQGGGGGGGTGGGGGKSPITLSPSSGSTVDLVVGALVIALVLGLLVGLIVRTRRKHAEANDPSLATDDPSGLGR
jgi:PKD repeat protein